MRLRYVPAARGAWQSAHFQLSRLTSDRDRETERWLLAHRRRPASRRNDRKRTRWRGATSAPGTSATGHFRRRYADIGQVSSETRPYGRSTNRRSRLGLVASGTTSAGLSGGGPLGPCVAVSGERGRQDPGGGACSVRHCPRGVRGIPGRYNRRHAGGRLREWRPLRPSP